MSNPLGKPGAQCQPDPGELVTVAGPGAALTEEQRSGLNLELDPRTVRLVNALPLERKELARARLLEMVGKGIKVTINNVRQACVLNRSEWKRALLEMQS